MYKTTTALRKISALRKRIWGIQGGQGAGKTISILMIITNHVSVVPNREVYIVSAELSKMRDTVIKDFLKIIIDFGLNPKLTGIDYGQPKALFPNGSFIRFIGLDKEDVGKGLRSDIIFVNEANKINFETYRQLTSRAKRVIIDFNPNSLFWFHTEVKNRIDCEFLTLTYKDNEYLSYQEIKEIEMNKTKGYKNPELIDYDRSDNILSEYWANNWRIYGLGIVGSVEGRIFNWKPIPYQDWLKLEVPIYYSVDWGKSDPFAIGCDKYYDGAIYSHELNYESENEIRRKLNATEIHQITGSNDDGIVNWMFQRLGVEKSRPIICDSNRPTKIKSLRNAGWEYAVGVRKPKGSIIDGIDLLQNMEVYYTETSTNIENEQNTYCWAIDRAGVQTEDPVDFSNHHIDRIRYTAMWLRDSGIIKKV